jgi:hypothetical protein
MDREHFIITVYCVVCEHYQAILKTTPLRQAGFTPALTDEEVITIEICGEYFKCATDKDIFDYLQANYPAWFPHLNDRTLFVRQAANLWWIKAAIQRRLTQISGQVDDPVQTIDTVPLPVCTYTRSRRDRCFKGEADYGYCAAKKLRYYGFKLGLRVARSGMIIAYPLFPARPHDTLREFVEDLTAEFVGYVPADKGFIDAWRQAVLEERRNVVIVTPRRKGMKKLLRPKDLVKACMRLRKCVETVGSHLTERFAIARTRAHDLWHYQHRVIRKILAHTIGVFLNLKLNRTPLDLDGLLSINEVAH